MKKRVSVLAALLVLAVPAVASARIIFERAAAGATNRTIASEVPATVKRTGVLSVATNGGFDSDLARALAGLMGLRVKFFYPPFTSVLPGVAAHRYDLGMFSISDTKAREKTVDFVTYFNSSISLYVRAGSAGISTLAQLCGHTVGVPTGTVEQSAANAQSSSCIAARQPAVRVMSFTNERSATIALLNGDVEVAMADTPIASSYVSHSNGSLVLAGLPFDNQPYGIAIAKHSGLTKATLDGLKLLISNGTYLAVLTKWGQRAGAVSHPKIDGAIS